MARPGDEKSNADDLSQLKNEIEEIKRFNTQLIKALKLAETKIQKGLEDSDVYLLPSGTYHGIKIE